MRYSVVLLDNEEGGYMVLVPELPGLVTEGDTVDEALNNARDAVDVHLRGLLASGAAVPIERKPILLAQVNVDVPGIDEAVAVAPD